jgi:hypothetical protein
MPDAAGFQPITAPASAMLADLADRLAFHGARPALRTATSWSPTGSCAPSRFPQPTASVPPASGTAELATSRLSHEGETSWHKRDVVARASCVSHSYPKAPIDNSNRVRNLGEICNSVQLHGDE